MRILHYTVNTPESGQGHYYRQVALSEAAKKQGHGIWLMSERNNFTARESELSFVHAMAVETSPDWVVIDLPGEVQPVFFNIAQRLDIKTCVIDGIGHPATDAEADIVVSQGFDTGRDGYGFPDYLLLRKEVFEHEWDTGYKLRGKVEPNIPIFVFGGAADGMGLLPYVQAAMPHRCLRLAITPHTQCDKLRTVWNHDTLACAGAEIFNHMENPQFAICAMGVSVLELCAIGVPTYVFSITARHLDTALNLHKEGYIKAFPRVGLPETVEEFLAFVDGGFVAGKRLGNGGPGRVLGLMEDYNVL